MVNAKKGRKKKMINGSLLKTNFSNSIGFSFRFFVLKLLLYKYRVYLFLSCFKLSKAIEGSICFVFL